MEISGSGPGKIPFETHLNRLQDPAKAMLLDLRNFVRALGSNVIEDVRPHRIVYSKTMNFRIFLDVEPSGDALVISIRFGRAAPPASLTVRTSEEIEAAKMQVAEAYQKIQ
jgi:hypothetical protein